ncbi:NUDIX domain-containing protein [Fodinibius salsisoli]|uniref:NUDIX domain-containing protein n=1 Tax=Fodinibius salsisoli TaxID=2820877 RepID=A0ABT3PPI1_9BACT|nr:NUDIX domain-containing protein [Fodinibius salsisoli]MCW9707774.1 NUDIX domain-containing protein [Fodinibius salsisoli]
MSFDNDVFSHRVRLRACGLLVQEEKILLVKIHSPVIDQQVWMPPGGEVEFGESMAQSLEREFQEETQATVTVGGLLHINELIDEPFHAVECYFEVHHQSGTPALGGDPELNAGDQLLEAVEWMPIAELDDRPFAPQSLLPKLKLWENRSSFTIFD